MSRSSTRWASAHWSAAITPLPSGARRLVVTEPSEFVYKQLFISGVVGLFGSPRPRKPIGDSPEPVG